MSFWLTQLYILKYGLTGLYIESQLYLPIVRSGVWSTILGNLKKAKKTAKTWIKEQQFTSFYTEHPSKDHFSMYHLGVEYDLKNNTGIPGEVV